MVLAALNRNSEVVTTSLGEMEYVLKGDGPVVLMIHGAPGGYDQSLVEMDRWINEGFSFLSVSRPGYLRTPLSTGESLEAQADAIEALLVTLGISTVAVIAVSAGGPIALHFALRHPTKIWALILMAAVTQEYVVKASQTDSFLARIFLSDSMADFGIWIFDVMGRRLTALTLKETFKQLSKLDSKEISDFVKQVMSIPEQVSWFKRFVRAGCPMTPRMVGLNNDLKHLENVSFTNLQDITCPTLVVHGTVDADVSFDHAEFATASIPNARLYSIENIGHIVTLGEHVSQMNSELVKFLREHM